MSTPLPNELASKIIGGSLCFSKTIVNGGDGENDGKEEIHVTGDCDWD